MRREARPAARQRPLPDAENSGGEVSLFTSSARTITEQYHAADGRSVTGFTPVRWRNGLLLLLRVRAAESGPERRLGSTRKSSEQGFGIDPLQKSTQCRYTPAFTIRGESPDSTQPKYALITALRKDYSWRDLGAVD